jgi:hypothetical protein
MPRSAALFFSIGEKFGLGQGSTFTIKIPCEQQEDRKFGDPEWRALADWGNGVMEYWSVALQHSSTPGSTRSLQNFFRTWNQLGIEIKDFANVFF